jgi:hypothetical protein
MSGALGELQGQTVVVIGGSAGIGLFSDPDGNVWCLQEIKTRLPGR